MALSLEAARAATRRRDWHLILGLSPPFAERDVQKARRELQRHAHQDKGGNPEYFNAEGGYSEGAWGTACQDDFGDEEAEVSSSQIWCIEFHDELARKLARAALWHRSVLPCAG